MTPTSSSATGPNNLRLGESRFPISVSVVYRVLMSTLGHSDGRLWIWTDGSFHSASVVGGWAWATPEGTQASGSLGNGVTSEYMELYAIRQALEIHQAPRFSRSHPNGLLIFCDHQGIVRNLNQHPRSFKTWATGSRRNPLTLPLLIGIELLMRSTPTEYRWTKGHARDAHNKVVDRLARHARLLRERDPDLPDLPPLDLSVDRKSTRLNSSHK
jgi:ribonuclease HI